MWKKRIVTQIYRVASTGWCFGKNNCFKKFYENVENYLLGEDHFY